MKKVLALIFTLISLSAHAQIIGTYPYTFANGQTIDANQFNSNFAWTASQVNANAANAGNNTNITQLSGLTTAISPALGGSSYFSGTTSTGSANAQAVTGVTPNNYALTANYSVSFLAGFSNTGPTTLAVSGTTATNIYRNTPAGPAPLVGGEIVAGNIVYAVYDGTRYQILNSASPAKPGTIEDYAGTPTPAGYHLCDGTAISRTTFAAAFAAYGTNWGTGDGSTTFNLPNLQGRMTAGVDNGAGNITNFSATLGNYGGNQNTPVLQTNLPSVNFVVASGISVSVTSSNGDVLRNPSGFTIPAGAAGGGIGTGSSSGGYTITSTGATTGTGTAASGGSGAGLNVLGPLGITTKICKL